MFHDIFHKVKDHKLIISVIIHKHIFNYTANYVCLFGSARMLAS